MDGKSFAAHVIQQSSPEDLLNKDTIVGYGADYALFVIASRFAYLVRFSDQSVSLYRSLDIPSHLGEEEVDLAEFGDLGDFDEITHFSSEEIGAAALSNISSAETTLVFSLGREIGDDIVAYFTEQLKETCQGRGWKSHALHNVEEEGEGRSIGRCFIGTVLGITPSGKYYTAFAPGSASAIEATIDSLWYEALETVAEAEGGWIEHGAGDPLDMFFCIDVTPEAEDDE